MKALGISLMGIPSDVVGEYAAVCIGMVVYTLSNYIFNRRLTFRK